MYVELKTLKKLREEHPFEAADRYIDSLSEEYTDDQLDTVFSYVGRPCAPYPHPHMPGNRQADVNVVVATWTISGNRVILYPEEIVVATLLTNGRVFIYVDEDNVPAWIGEFTYDND